MDPPRCTDVRADPCTCRASRIRHVILQFSDEDRANFEAEIAEHIKDRENFAKAQRHRNSAVNKPQPNQTPEEKETKQNSMRRAVVHHQKKVRFVPCCIHHRSWKSSGGFFWEPTPRSNY